MKQVQYDVRAVVGVSCHFLNVLSRILLFGGIVCIVARIRPICTVTVWPL